MSKNKTSWDSQENEAQNNFVSWGQVGDFVYGTLIGIREVKSTLPDKVGEMQKIYDVLVKECSYHTLDEKKRVIEEVVKLSEGDLISVGGRKTIDSRMARVKLGQVFGLKFVEEQPNSIKGYSATKLIKVYTPKDSSGEVEMNEEWLETQKDSSMDDFK